MKREKEKERTRGKRGDKVLIRWHLTDIGLLFENFYDYSVRGGSLCCYILKWAKNCPSKIFGLSMTMNRWIHFQLFGHFPSAVPTQMKNMIDTTKYTFTIMQEPALTYFHFPNHLNSWWHGFNNVLDTFLRGFSSYWHDSIRQLLEICQLYNYDVNLL